MTVSVYAAYSVYGYQFTKVFSQELEATGQKTHWVTVSERLLR